MNWNTVNSFLSAHHIFPVAVFVTLVWRLFRPVLLEHRAAIVHALAVLRAIAKTMHVTDADIAAELPSANRAIPAVPDPNFAAGTTGLGALLGSAALVATPVTPNATPPDLHPADPVNSRDV